MSLALSSQFLTLASVHFLAVALPGPDFTVTVSQSLRHGRTLGIWTAAGIGAGISLHVIYTLLGVSALLIAYPWLLQITSLLGIAYLTWIAMQLLRSKAGETFDSASNIKIEQKKPPTKKDKWRAFNRGLLTNATNPKATLFFLSIFTTIVAADTPILTQILYGAWMCCVNALWFVLVASLVTASNFHLALLRHELAMQRFMGIALLGFASKLIFQITI